MDLDARGSQAASSLRHQVEPALDVEGARHAVTLGVARRRSRHSVATGLALAVATVVAVTGLAVVSLSGLGRTDGSAFEIDSGRSEADMAVLGDLPRTPIDGRDSWRLPVVAKPLTELEDGARIRVYGRGFQPGELVGVVMCAREAESEGVGGCMLGDDDYVFAHVTSSSAYEDGTVVQDFTVRRHITTPATGPIDCASEAERCLVAVGAADNYDRSGGTYVNFAGAPPFPESSFTVDPAGPYTPGQEVTARAEGLPPGRLHQVQQCADDVCVPLARGFTAPDGTFTAQVTVNSVVYGDDDEVVECADRCTLQFTGVGPPNATTLTFPDPVPLTFGPGEPLAADQVPPPSTQPPAGPQDVVPLPDEGDTTSVPSASTMPPDVEGTGPSAPTTSAPTTSAPTPASSQPG